MYPRESAQQAMNPRESVWPLLTTVGDEPSGVRLTPSPSMAKDGTENVCTVKRTQDYNEHNCAHHNGHSNEIAYRDFEIVKSNNNATI